jgi:hypothetical protein
MQREKLPESLGEWLMSMIGRNRLAGSARTVQQENEARTRGDEGALREMAREIAALREAIWAIQKLHTERDVRLNQELKDFIMSAIDDLKTEVQKFLDEGLSDINTLVGRIATSSNNDPAIVDLTNQVKSATAKMHDAFQTAIDGSSSVSNAGVSGQVGTVPPATSPAPSGPGPSSIDPVTGQPLPPGA